MIKKLKDHYYHLLLLHQYLLPLAPMQTHWNHKFLHDQNRIHFHHWQQHQLQLLNRQMIKKVSNFCLPLLLRQYLGLVVSRLQFQKLPGTEKYEHDLNYFHLHHYRLLQLQLLNHQRIKIFQYQRYLLLPHHQYQALIESKLQFQK